MKFESLRVFKEVRQGHKGMGQRRPGCGPVGVDSSCAGRRKLKECVPVKGMAAGG